ncbi:MAG: hypothetical protein WEB07_02290 [Natronospirillum sp.]
MSPQNQNVRQHVQRDEYREDEIDLGELISNVWRTKWRVLIALAVVAAVYLGTLAASFLTTVQTTRYEQVFDLTFEGLSDGEFPDGSPFVLSDVVSPSVLNQVYRNNQLQDYGLTLDEFRRSINVEPYSPDFFLIRARYQRLLSDSNLSAAETAELQSNMRAEMSLAQSGSVRLSMQLPPQRQVSTAIAHKVLSDTAETWAIRAIEERGVLRLNLPIYSARIFDESRFEELDYLIGIELLLENISLIEGNVVALKQQPNASNIRDEASGFNLEDLQKSISDVAQYDLRQLIDPVKELGLTRNENVVRLFYSRQLQDLGLEMRFWEQRAQLTREVLATYSRDELQNARPEGIAPSGHGSLSPQLGDAFLDRLVDISGQGGEQEFRQALTLQVLEYENNALDINQNMEKIQLTLNAIESAGQGTSDLRTVYQEEVQNSLPKVLATLREQTAVIGRLHGQLGRQASGSVSEIITPQGGSFQAVTSALIERRHALIFIALMVLTGFVSLFGCLIFDMIKRRRMAEQLSTNS